MAVLLAIRIPAANNAGLYFASLCSMSIAYDHILDACGLFCPEPVMMLHNKIRDIRAGEILRVTATDPSTQRDIPKFCVFLGHELLEQHETASVFYYYIRKN